MCPDEAWEEARCAGVYHGSDDDRRDGFLHFSTGEQVAESARRHRAGQTGLVLVAVESARLGDRLKWEPSRGGQLFPHLYGPLDPSEVSSVRLLPVGPDGLHVFPPLARSAIPPPRVSSAVRGSGDVTRPIDRRRKSGRFRAR
ncbi:MAG TPA: DUF952 domain-containing protein [Stellaceae bacterium]|nr:DUF952 domain-containing protein [Stellaceae bacterium]